MVKKQDKQDTAFSASRLVTRVMLSPRRMCETRGGEIAFSLGRLRLTRGSPMLVEHLNGLYLEHALCGRVLTTGYGDEFDITHIFGDDGY